MIHRLGNLSNDFDGFSALAALAADAVRLVEGDLELSFASVSRIDPNMAAPLGAMLAKVTDRNHAVSITDVPPLHEEVLTKNGFLPSLGFPPSDQRSATAIPYQQFRITDAQRFYDYLETHLRDKGLPEMTSDFPLRFQMCLGEVFANAETHSDSSLGVFVCGQFYPTEQRLAITIADAGVTIPERFHRRFGIQWPPLRVLRWALTEGKTTKQGTPGGVGLKLVREFVCANEGRVQIASGKAFWHFRGGVESFNELDNLLPGTVVTVEVNTANWTLSCEPRRPS